MDRMHDSDVGAGESIARELDRELAEVEAAIALVRSGGSTAVSLTNLRFGEQILHQIRARGADHGVRLEPVPWPDDIGCDIDVRRIDA